MEEAETEVNGYVLLDSFHRYTVMWQSVRCYERREKCCLAALQTIRDSATSQSTRWNTYPWFNDSIFYTYSTAADTFLPHFCRAFVHMGYRYTAPRDMVTYGQSLTATWSVHHQTCQVSRISRDTHAFSMSLTLSLRTVEISRIFLLNEKQYF